LSFALQHALAASDSLSDAQETEANVVADITRVRDSSNQHH